VFLAGLLALPIASCNAESRTAGADLPQTAPSGPDDPRIASYQRNLYQIAQGGRYFTWYGCGGCHGAGARGALNLGDQAWRHGAGFDQVYAYIAKRHPGTPAGYAARIPVEQLWQVTAYVRTLPQLPAEKRRRQDLDQVGEPQGSNWSGPVH
jgi:cytochrome c oxidase cbb3-type subunit III